MMNFFFSEPAVDIRDTTNRTGMCPPFELEIAAGGGLIFVRIARQGETRDELRQGGITPEQCRRLIAGLREALADAER